jgi:hypothetical protein
VFSIYTRACLQVEAVEHAEGAQGFWQLRELVVAHSQVLHCVRVCAFVCARKRERESWLLLTLRYCVVCVCVRERERERVSE